MTPVPSSRNPIELLVCAIATQENNPLTNPGNLRYAGQHQACCLRCGARGGVVPLTCKGSPSHDIATFVGDKQGTARQWGTLALYRDVLAKTGLGMAIAQAISVYAPPNENETATYLRNVLEWTGLPADVPLVQLLPPLVPLNTTSGSSST
jgi:hypothetical protein